MNRDFLLHYIRFLVEYIFQVPAPDKCDTKIIFIISGWVQGIIRYKGLFGFCGLVFGSGTHSVHPDISISVAVSSDRSQ